MPGRCMKGKKWGGLPGDWRHHDNTTFEPVIPVIEETLAKAASEIVPSKRLEDATVASHFKRQFRTLSLVTLPDAGHMMHHERPQAVAELIEEFFR